MESQAPSRLRGVVSAPFAWLGNALVISGSILLLVRAGSAVGPRPHVMAEELAAYGFIGHLAWAAGVGVAAFARLARRPLWQLPLLLPVILAFGALSTLPAFATGLSIVILGIGLAGPVTFPVDLTLPCLTLLSVASVSAVARTLRDKTLRRGRRAYRLAWGAIGCITCACLGISEQERTILEERLQSAPPEKRLVEYARNLSSDFPRTRAWAARGLAGLGPRASSALPALTTALGDRWFQARIEAIGALGAIGPEAETAIPAMIRTVRNAPPSFFNDRPSEREMLQKPLVKALLRIAPQRLPELLAAYADNERYWMVNDMSSYLGEQASTAVPALCRLIEGPDKPIRPAAVYSLFHLLNHHRDGGVVEPLLRATEDPDPDLCSRAVQALGRTKDPRALPRVLSLTENPNEDVRSNAAEALGGLFAGARSEPERQVAVERLAQMAEKDSRRARIAAINALASIGPAAYSAIPALQRAAASTDEYIRWCAERALDRVALEK